MRRHTVGLVIAICLFAALLLTHAQDSKCDPQRSVCPQAGFVPNADTAVRIAEAVLGPIYGNEHIKHEKPFTARLDGNRWIVTGTLPTIKDPHRVVVGGTATVEIDKADGRIIAVYHLK